MLPKLITPLDRGVVLTTIEHSRLLAAEHHMKGQTGYWTWLAADDLVWTRTLDKRLKLKSRSGRKWTVHPVYSWQGGFRINEIESYDYNLKFVIHQGA